MWDYLPSGIIRAHAGATDPKIFGGVTGVSPAKGEQFIAKGRVVRAGKTLTVCLGEVFAEEEGKRKQVALMTASMMVVNTSSGLRD